MLISVAGGRLATDLKDTPVAYSILTRDYIDAGALVDSTDFASVDTSTPNNSPSLDVNGAVNSYNNLRIARQNAVANNYAYQRPASANFTTMLRF